MSQEHKTASTSSSCRKHKDIPRHDKKGLLTTVSKEGDQVLIRNPSEKGSTGKMRSLGKLEGKLGRQIACGLVHQLDPRKMIIWFRWVDNDYLVPVGGQNII